MPRTRRPGERIIAATNGDGVEVVLEMSGAAAALQGPYLVADGNHLVDGDGEVRKGAAQDLDGSFEAFGPISGAAALVFDGVGRDQLVRNLELSLVEPFFDDPAVDRLIGAGAHVVSLL